MVFLTTLPSSFWAWWPFLYSFLFRFFGLRTLKENEHIPSSVLRCAFKRLFESFKKIFFFTYMIFAWALVLVTNTMYSSLSTLGMSSQNMASPVACLRPDTCMMGRPTGSWKGWWESTLYRGRQELLWKTLIFRSRLASYHTCDSGLRNKIVTGVAQMMNVTI